MSEFVRRNLEGSFRRTALALAISIFVYVIIFVPIHLFVYIALYDERSPSEPLWAQAISSSAAIIIGLFAARLACNRFAAGYARAPLFRFYFWLAVIGGVFSQLAPLDLYQRIFAALPALSMAGSAWAFLDHD